jgi:hypothetical protein
MQYLEGHSKVLVEWGANYRVPHSNFFGEKHFSLEGHPRFF